MKFQVQMSKVESQKSFQTVGPSKMLQINLQPLTFNQSPIAHSSLINRQSSITNHQSILFRLLSFLKGSWRLVALSVLLSTLTIGSSVALIGTSAWLISTAALHPSVADLGVSVVGVRFFGISRGVFRYLERLVSHNVTFRLLARLRVWFYEKLEPLAPARLMEYKSGDLLARVIGDVETLENFYVRVISPSLTAIFVGLGVALFFAFFYPPIALVLIGFFLVLGLILPLLSQIVSREPGQTTDHTARRHPDPSSWMASRVSQTCSPLAAARTAWPQIAQTGNIVWLHPKTDGAHQRHPFCAWTRC